VPAQVVISAPNVDSTPVSGAIANLKREALASGQMHQPITVEVNRQHTLARVSIPLIGDGTNAASEHALRTLRGSLVPETVGAIATAYVSGPTAKSVDFNHQLNSRAPYVFAFVLGLAFLLLLWNFRSLVIPTTAIALNLLSVGAAYGVLVSVFQGGWGLVHFPGVHHGPITAWLPLFLFVILFGLSMDYHVFILSRIREGYDKGMGTDEAIAHGIKSTAGVVSSAAIVMVGVFSIFGALQAMIFKQFGVGLAAAILIDATIIRAILLPASMKLLGEWNWYLPKWLEWIPHIEHEGKVEPAEAPPMPTPAA